MKTYDYKSIKVTEEQFIKLELMRIELRAKKKKSVSKGDLIQVLMDSYEEANNEMK